MKKEFMEPEMKRIELNLKENIAESGGTGTHGNYVTTQDQQGCMDYIQGTWVTPIMLDTADSTTLDGRNIILTAYACYEGTARTAVEAFNSINGGI